MSCSIGFRHGSDPTLLWLWYRPVATAPIQPKTCEPPYAAGASLKKKTKQKKRKSIWPLLWTLYQKNRLSPFHKGFFWGVIFSLIWKQITLFFFYFAWLSIFVSMNYVKQLPLPVLKEWPCIGHLSENYMCIVALTGELELELGQMWTRALLGCARDGHLGKRAGARVGKGLGHFVGYTGGWQEDSSWSWAEMRAFPRVTLVGGLELDPGAAQEGCWVSFGRSGRAFQTAASALRFTVSEFMHNPFKNWVSISYNL